MANDAFVGRRLKTIVNRIKRLTGNSQAIRDMEDMTSEHGFIIGYLHHRGQQSDVYQKDIEREFDIRSSTATVMLNKMEKNGLITRTASDKDKRYKRIELTPRAMEMHVGIIAEFRKMEKMLTAGIDEAELTAFSKTLDKLEANLDAAEAAQVCKSKEK